MTQPELELRRAWRQIAGSRHESTVESLMLRYAEPQRHYHTATHVMMVLRDIDQICLACGRPRSDELIAAALYHDAVYDPRADDNERQSAALASRHLSEAGWDEARCVEVETLIMATAHLGGTRADHPSATDTAIMLDADLAILGAEPSHYLAYSNLVRAEYAFVADDQWRTGRSRVLQTFLDRDRLFHTDWMYQRCERRARANIEAELVTLRRPSG
jgi:predicted metal-dependent HD superfamily phosphohydrolase